MLVIKVAVVFNALAWGTTVAYRRWPLASALVLSAIWIVTCFFPWAYVANAIDQYSTGEAMMIARGLVSRLPSPDPETRLGYSPSCTAGYTANIHNGTLRLLVRTFGPIPGTYQGPYPSRQEYRVLIDTPDASLSRAEVDSGALVRIRGSIYRFPKTSRVGKRLDETIWHASQQDVLTLRYLSDQSLLVGDRVRGGIWVKDDQGFMSVWADYSDVFE